MLWQRYSSQTPANDTWCTNLHGMPAGTGNPAETLPEVKDEKQKTNVMVVGKTGSGKTVISVDVMRTFLSEQQLRDWRELRKNIQKDGKSAGDKDHDNQQ